MNKNFYFFFAVLCCMFSFLLPQKAQAYPEYWESKGIKYMCEHADGAGAEAEVVEYSEGVPNYSHLSGSVVIPASSNGHPVTKIGKSAFCMKVQGDEFYITLPSSIKTIGDVAFLNAHKLGGITLNEGLTEMGVDVFAGCSTLVSVKIPTTLKTIPEFTFSRCASLPSIAFPANIASIERGAFSECISLESVTGTFTKYIWVSSIGDEAFNRCTNLQTISFSGNLTSIGRRAFFYCTKLENIALPANLKTIGEEAFSHTGLKVVTNYSPTPQTIEANVFNHVDLKKCILYVPKGCKNAYKNADVWKNFSQILEQGEVPIPTGEQKIGDFWYDLHEDLTATLIPHDDYKNFSGAISIPSSVSYDKYTYTVNELRHHVFSECDLLTEVTIPNTITEISSGVFTSCHGLTKVTLPSSLTSIGVGAFIYCYALNNISLPASLTELGTAAFQDCKSLTSISIPAGVKVLPDNCFYECVKLTKVNLPDGLTDINDRAFAYCSSLKTITLPASVTTVGNLCFEKCENLESVRVLSNTPPQTEYEDLCSSSTYSSCILYVPSETQPKYAAAKGWKKFTNIQEKGQNIKIKYGKLYYQLSEDGTAYVTYETQDANNYKDLSGEITVEDKITYKGYEYNVYAVGKNALRNCKGITKVNLPLIMDYILDSAFYFCANLEQINLPTTMTILYNTALSGTKVSSQNRDADGAVYYDGCMLWGPKATYSGEYVVKEGTRLIATHVFEDRDNITSLTLPEGLQCVCTSAILSMDNLKTISLPSSLYSIGTFFCGFCKKLTTIYNYSTDPVYLLSTASFNLLTKSNCTLYVPKGCKEAYEEVGPWNGFPIMEMNGIYTVTFVDYNGFEIKTEKVAEGENAHAPTAPEREGYDFTGWDKNFTNVQSNLIITAQYERQQFTVRFLDGFDNNALIDQQQVEWGLTAIAPEPPVHEGYHFIGWSVEFDIVMNNLDVIAQYEEGEGIDDIRVNADKAQKVLIDGAIFIALPNGTIYDASGTQVK